MSRPTSNVSWAESAVDGIGVIEPTSKEANGWIPGDEPPAEWQNWLQRETGRWIKYFDATRLRNNAIIATRNWTERSASAAVTWTSVIWSPDLQLFVAGTDGSSTMNSVNGITWSTGTGNANAVSIAWSPTLPIFASVGTTGVSSSADGITWTARTPPSGARLTSVVWAPSLAKFVAVASNGLIGQQVAISTDGINWSNQSSTSVRTWQSVTWSPSLGLLCAVASDGTAAQQIMTSADGVTWFARTAPTNSAWASICWSPELSVFVAVASSSTAAMYSSDGITWHASTLPATTGTMVAVTWSPELMCFVTVTNLGVVFVSFDGVTWAKRGSFTANNWGAIAYSPDLRMFCAVAQNGTNRVLTSL